MQLNYHFLTHLVRELRSTIIGLTVSSCYSQSKDEIIFSLTDGSSQCYIRAQLSSNFTCLTFPAEHHRAKRNSVDLFGDTINSKVLAINMLANDRSFIIRLSENYELLFKLHGNRSNVILYEQGSFVEMFNNRLKKDQQMLPSDIAKPHRPDLESWSTNPSLRHHFPTFGPRVLAHLAKNDLDTLSPNEQWLLITRIIDMLSEAKHFFIEVDERGMPFLTMFESDQALSKHDTPTQACNALSKYYHQTYLFDQEKSKYTRLLTAQISKTDKYVKNTRRKLDSLHNKRSYDEVANIIMANLHAIPNNVESVELNDIYTSKPILIKLKPNVSPQKLAEQYYRKSKNQSKERQNLEENLLKKEAELVSLESLISALSTISDRKHLRQFVHLNLTDQINKQEEKRLPYYQQEIDGFEVRIGKSAKDNDLMLRQYSHKDDTWLHARDVPGSHVLIRHQKHLQVSKDVIEKVAQLAAYYSKRKHDSLAPVIYTARKFVRKSKNLLPGQVIVDKENVVIVKPAKTPSPSH